MGIEDLIEEAKFEMLAGQYEDAEKFLLRALKQDKDNVEALFDLGVLYEITHKQFKALECFQKVLEINPEHKEAREHVDKLAEF